MPERISSAADSQATLPTAASVTSQPDRKRGDAIAERQQPRARRIGREQEARGERRRQRDQRRGDVGQNERSRRAGRRRQDRRQHERDEREGAEPEQIDQEPIQRAGEPLPEAVGACGAGLRRDGEAPPDRGPGEKARAEHRQQAADQGQGIGPAATRCKAPTISAGAMSAPWDELGGARAQVLEQALEP